jgi:Uma2 family endonuclease
MNPSTETYSPIQEFRTPLIYQKTLPKNQTPLKLIEELEFKEDPLESDWHVSAMTLLINILRYHWRDRNDIYISGNTSVYFDQNQTNKFRGPDLYVVKSVPKKPRSSWQPWKENHSGPDFVLELASKSSAKFDVDGKKTIYERDFKTPEYVVYNPDTHQLQGWRLENGYYQAISTNDLGWLWCEELGLWLGLGPYDFLDGAGLIKTPRFFDSQDQLLPTREEIEAQRAKAAEAEIARLKALLNKK